MVARSTLVLAVLLGGVAALAAAQAPAGQRAEASPSPSPSTSPSPSPSASPSAGFARDDETAIYALGFSIWRTLGPLDLSPAEVAILKRGLSDAAEGKPRIPFEETAPKVEALRRARAQRAAEKEKARAAEYLEEAEKAPGAVKTASGLVFIDLRPGTGNPPQADDIVKVHYRGRLIDGTEFDSSYRRPQPAQFSLKSMIPCWREGVQKMKAGGKARLLCPSSLAYGDRGQPARDPRRVSIPGGAALIFEVELVDIAKAAPSPAATPSPGAPSTGPGSSR